MLRSVQQLIGIVPRDAYEKSKGKWVLEFDSDRPVQMLFGFDGKRLRGGAGALRISRAEEKLNVLELFDHVEWKFGVRAKQQAANKFWTGKKGAVGRYVRNPQAPHRRPKERVSQGGGQGGAKDPQRPHPGGEGAKAHPLGWSRTAPAGEAGRWGCDAPGSKGSGARTSASATCRPGHAPPSTANYGQRQQ